MTEREAALTDILRRIVAQTDDGPGACMGREGSGAMVWKGSFRSLLWEAGDAIGSPRPVKVSGDVGFGVLAAAGEARPPMDDL